MRPILILLMLGFGLQACGYKGPLSLPAPTAQTPPPASSDKAQEKQK